MNFEIVPVLNFDFVVHILLSLFDSNDDEVIFSILGRVLRFSGAAFQSIQRI